VVFRTGLMQMAGCLIEGDESEQGSRESVGLCETDESRGLNPRRLGGPADYGGGQRAVAKK